MATCPRPSCKGLIVSNKCSKCGAFTYVSAGSGSQTRNNGTGGEVQGTGIWVPPSLMKLHQWKHQTRLNGKLRSAALRRVDLALKEYEINKGPMKLGKLRLCFDAWCNSKGGLEAPWMDKTNDRNCRNAVSVLAKQLNGERVALPSDFMNPDIENARLGIVYFFSKLDFEFNNFKLILEAPAELMGNISTFGAFGKSSDAIDTGIGLGAEIFKTGTISSTELMDQGLKNLQEAETPHGRRLQAVLSDFVKNILSNIISMFKISWENVEKWTNLVVDTTKGLVKICTSVLAKAVAPFISGAMDVISGLAKAIKGVGRLIVDAWKGRSVQILSGHPSTIHTALRAHMSRSIFEGLYVVIKGALGLVMDSVAVAIPVASAGIALAKSIANLVLAVLELIAKFVYRIFEGIFINKFIGKARNYWDNRSDQMAIHRDHERFNAWYRQSALVVPVLAALTINGNICGDAMRFLQVLNDDGSVITQSQFTAGVGHINSLKQYGKDLVEKSGWHFYSQDAIVQGALKRLAEKDKADFSSTVQNVVWNLVGA